MAHALLEPHSVTHFVGNAILYLLMPLGTSSSRKRGNSIHFF